ncbi:hypothetical protein, partial [Massilia mucilaginosa]|uniref:hypothetical protein n=1 Tax=Massilia mucilaginosa TaxID=2609282 RepID=UPI001CB6DD37
RVSDKIVCRAYITDGSANVFIGGAAVQTNSFMPEGIFEEVVELVENGATLVLGAGEIVVGGFYNSVVRIGAGLASIPYMLDSVDAAVGVQKEIAEGLNYNFRSDGAKQIGEALKPVGAYVQEKITVAKDFSEEHIGLGATAVVFGSAEAVVEIAGVVSGGKVVKSFIDFPLPGANSSTAAVANGNISPQNPLNADSISRNPNRNLVKQVGPTCGHNSCGMVLNTLGKSVDIGDLIKKIPPGKDGIYSRDVATLLKSEGIDAVALGRRNVSAP